MDCPFGDHPLESALQIRDVLICKTCGGSVYSADGTVRPAVGADWIGFDGGEMASLRHARGAIARKDRK